MLRDVHSLRRATLAWTFWDNADNAGAEKILKAALDARTVPKATPAEFRERYNYGWLIEEVCNKLPEALDHYMRALQAPVRIEYGGAFGEFSSCLSRITVLKYSVHPSSVSESFVSTPINHYLRRYV